ncbi:unnamed protein product [Spirodela intermedia]|uniref:Protein BZR1 homolog n=1 Tax=Spirodela intermedia TaxID=51605 RepID=A0A7I8ID50_SPIIN|nr:unnamed protein product [Spirodela intermedia]CAA6655589.1 unnamed protein product [Spirodela intermedia]
MEEAKREREEQTGELESRQRLGSARPTCAGPRTRIGTCVRVKPAAVRSIADVPTSLAPHAEKASVLNISANTRPHTSETLELLVPTSPRTGRICEQPWEPIPAASASQIGTADGDQQQKQMMMIGAGGASGVGMRRCRPKEEKERTKLRERHRRAITARILSGLRRHGNYNLRVRADINEVIAALAREAGWTVLPDGTTFPARATNSQVRPCDLPLSLSLSFSFSPAVEEETLPTRSSRILWMVLPEWDWTVRKLRRNPSRMGPGWFRDTMPRGSRHLLFRLF